MPKNIITLVCLFILFLSPNLFAARILNVKAKKVYLEMDGDSIRTGEILHIYDDNGKKRGIIKVVKAKGKRAIARLGKGKAKKGWEARKRTASKKKISKRTAKKSMDRDGDEAGRTFVGGMVGFASDSMTATIEIDDAGTTEDSSLSGSGFSAKALFDYGLWEQIWFRGMLGLENFEATSDDQFCGDNQDEACGVTISYMSLDLWGRYMLSQSPTKFWIGGGINVMIPSSSDTTALDDESITSTSVFAAGLGLDWFLSKKMYIPLQLEYGMFPSSTDVSASYISFRAGAAFAF